MLSLLALWACDGGEVAGPDTADTATERVITDYLVNTWTDPEPPVAGETFEFYEQVTDQDGVPVEDLQTNHERLIHNVFISADWSTYAHVHHEDYAAVTVSDLKAGTLHLPVSLPLAGRYLVALNFAHANQWLTHDLFLDVTGTPAMAAAPDTTPSAEAQDDDVTATLAWAAAPVAEFAATWTVTFHDLDGNEVTDITPYLGADAHAALVSEDLGWVSHTHAYVPGMETMSPSMDMPHLYPGPFVDFQYVFPAPGTYKMWVQFTRESAPGRVYTLPFVFDVAG